MNRPPELTLIAALLLLTAAGALAFWGVFAADLDAQRGGYLASECDCWYVWERSFPLADAWMSVTAVLAAVGVWSLRPAGLLWGLICGGALVFLGLMDMLFFVQNGLYVPLNGEVALELAIHAGSILVGLLSIAVIWRHRARLLGFVASDGQG
ncbi:MAG: hypothetical protein JXJ20_13175 [Anaerolineae bacterium]|nr:hypothetical protein [Anaerolineae bacterium]